MCQVRRFKPFQAALCHHQVTPASSIHAVLQLPNIPTSYLLIRARLTLWPLRATHWKQNTASTLADMQVCLQLLAIPSPMGLLQHHATPAAAGFHGWSAGPPDFPERRRSWQSALCPHPRCPEMALRWASLKVPAHANWAGQ